MRPTIQQIIMRETAAQLVKAFKARIRIQQHDNGKNNDPVLYVYFLLKPENKSIPGAAIHFRYVYFLLKPPNKSIPGAAIHFRPDNIVVMFEPVTDYGKLNRLLEWTGSWYNSTNLEYADPNLFDRIQDLVGEQLQ